MRVVVIMLCITLLCAMVHWVLTPTREIDVIDLPRQPMILRLARGIKVSKGLIQDEMGMMWEWEKPLPQDATCLLWIDTQGTEGVTDDTLSAVYVIN